MGDKKLDAHLVSILKRLETGSIRPESLDYHLRKKLVLFLLREDSTITNSRISQMIGISQAHVGRIRKAVLRMTTWDVDAEVRELVNLVWMKSNEYQRRAVRSNDAAAAWKIFRESIELLQGLGFVFEAPKKIALAHFDGTADLQSALKRMFSESGVPTLPEFIDRFKQLTAGGNGNGNNHGNKTVLDVAPTGGDAGHEPGNGKGNGGGPIGVVLPDRRGPGNNPDGEKGGPHDPPPKPPQNG